MFINIFVSIPVVVLNNGISDMGLVIVKLKLFCQYNVKTEYHQSIIPAKKIIKIIY